jgi:hypothetical protein
MANTTVALLRSLQYSLADVLDRPVSAINWDTSEEGLPVSQSASTPTQVLFWASLFGYSASHWTSLFQATDLSQNLSLLFQDSSTKNGFSEISLVVTSVTATIQDQNFPSNKRILLSQQEFKEHKLSETAAPNSGDTTTDLIRLLIAREEKLIASAEKLHQIFKDRLLDKLLPQLDVRSHSRVEAKGLLSDTDVWAHAPDALGLETDDTATTLSARKLMVEPLAFFNPLSVHHSIDEETRWVRDDEFFPRSRYVKLTLSGSNYFAFGEFGALCDTNAIYDRTRLRNPSDDVAWCEMKVVTFTEQWGTCDGIQPATNLTCYDDPDCHGSPKCQWSAHSIVDRSPETCLSTYNANHDKIELILDFGRPVQVAKWFVDTLNNCAYGPVTAVSIEISNSLDLSALPATLPGAASAAQMASAATWVTVLPPTQLTTPNVYYFAPSVHSAWEGSKVRNKLNFGELYKSHGLENEYFEESGGYYKGWVAEAGMSFTNSFNFQRESVHGQHMAVVVSTPVECKSWANVWNRRIGDDDGTWIYRIYDLMLGGQCVATTPCHSTVQKGVDALKGTLSGLDSLSQKTVKDLCAHPCEYFHIGGGINDMSVPGCDCKKGRSEGADCNSIIEVQNSSFSPVWQLIFRQSNSSSGYKPKGDWWKSYDPINVNSTTVVGDVNWLEGIDSYRSSESEALLFKIMWPQKSGINFNTWSQISNPLKNTEGGVTGYAAQEVHFQSKFWGGLEYNSGPQSLLDGSVDSLYSFYSIGATAAYDLESTSHSSGGLLGPGSVEEEVELYISGPAPKEAYLYSETISDASFVTFSYQVEFGQLTLQASQNSEWVNLWSIGHGDGGLEGHKLWSQCTDGGKNVGSMLCGKSGQATVDLKLLQPPFQLRFLPNLMSHLNPQPMWASNWGANPSAMKYELRQMAPAMSVDNIAVNPLCVAAPIPHGTAKYTGKAGATMTVDYECDQGFQLVGAPQLTCTPKAVSSPGLNFWTTKRSKFVRLRMMAFDFSRFAGFAAFDNAGQPVVLKELNATDLLTGMPIVSFGQGLSTDGDPTTCFDSGVWDYADLELLYEIQGGAVDIEKFELDANNRCDGGPVFNLEISLSDQTISGPWYVSQPWVQIGFRKHTFKNDASLRWLRRDASLVQTAGWSGSPPACKCVSQTPVVPPAIARVEVGETSATIHFAKLVGVGVGCAEYAVHVFESSSSRRSLVGVDSAKVATFVGASSPIKVTSLNIGVDYRFSMSAKAGGSQSAETALSSPVKLACAAGKVKQRNRCVSCKLGKFSPTAGLSDCLSCPIGKFTKNKNARWMLVYRQSLSDFRSKADWLVPTGINLNNSEAPTFSRLGALEGFRMSDGNFTFKLCWPLKHMPNEMVWKQASNPMVAEGKVVSKYKSVDTMLSKSSDVEFAGLKYETSGFFIMSGQVGSGAFYGVGFTPAFKATGTPGLPGPGSSEEMVELWCQIDYLSGTADMSTPNDAESNAAKLLDRQLSTSQADGGCARSMCLVGCQEDAQSDVGVTPPWWSVDFGSRMPISAVALTNRLDYEDTRDATTPYMSISAGDSLDELIPCAANISLGAGETLSVACRAEARFVKVAYADQRLFKQAHTQSGSKTRAGYLATQENRVMNLCEVSIQGGWGETGHTSCASCPVGQTTSKDSTGATIGCVEQCEAGKFGELGSYYEGTECFTCAPGQFSIKGAFGSCRSCPSGKFQASPGSSYCGSCDRGQYACSSGMASCATPPPQKCPSACNAKSLELFCVASKHGDGVCNPECNTVECDYDGGDCDALGFCNDNTGGGTGKCHSRMLGDGHCDLECSTASCNFDNGDCCLRKTKISVVFNVSNHHDKDKPIERLMPKQDTPRRRTIGMRNVVVGGVVLDQQRGAPGQCKYAGRFNDLGASCAGSALVNTPYGVDPVFLTTSTLYNEYIASRKSVYYDIDDPTRADPVSKQPYGFRHSGSGYPIVLDINLDQTSARKRVTYLKEGFYIDELTKKLTLDLLVYNGPSGLFASIQYDCKFEENGLIKMDFNVGVFQVELYKGVAGTVRLVLETLFFVYILNDMAGEFGEMCRAWRQKGSIFRYFKSLWNYLDLLNLALFLVQCIRWIIFVSGPAKNFDPQPRYNVYENLQAGANYYELASSGKGLENMMGVITDANNIKHFFQAFRSNLMINIFLMILRTFKNLDFQPRLRLVTATLENAFIDLVHFLILFLLVLLIFGFSSYIILGQKIEELSTPYSAFKTCLALGFLGDTVLLAKINSLTDPTLSTVAIFWFYAFVLLVNVLLLNILLAILVDAYVKVKDLQGDSNVPSVFVELQTVLKTLFRGRLLNPRLQRNTVALSNLTHLQTASGFFENEDGPNEAKTLQHAMEFTFEGDKYYLDEDELQRAMRSFRNSNWSKTDKTIKMTGKSVEQTVHTIFSQFSTAIEEITAEEAASENVADSIFSDMVEDAVEDDEERETSLPPVSPPIGKSIAKVVPIEVES